MSKLKDDIRGKSIPDKVTAAPEWNIFLKFIDKHEFNDKQELSNYLDTEIQERRNWLMENRNNPTASTQRREKTRELEMMDVFRMKILPHL